MAERDRKLAVPEDLLAERALLSALMLPTIAEHVDDVFEHVSPEDFARAPHRVLFAAFRHLHAQGKPTDPISVKDALQARGQLDRDVSVEYLSDLLDVAPSASSVPQWCAIVRARALERKVLAAGESIATMARERQREGEELAAQAEAVLLEATDRASVHGPEAVRNLVWPALELVEQRHADPRHLIGVPSGLTDLDGLTCGWRDGHYVVVAARPSIGKTALALHLANHAAANDVPTAVFSLEMGRDELVMRLLAAEAGLDSRRLELGKLGGDDFRVASEAGGRVAKRPLLIDDMPARSVASVRATARRLHRRQGVRLVVIDYLQLLRPDERHENRNTEITAISQGLKALAKTLQCPVIVLSQLSRAVEGRGDKAPLLSDLRDSGSIEQDADDVLFLWRDPKKQLTEPATSPISMLLAKQRNGPTGRFDAWYDKRTGRWADWSARTEDAAA